MPVRAIDRGGALTTTDGAIVRALELTPHSALAATSERGASVLDGVAALLGRLTPGEALQWYAESRPVAADELSPPFTQTAVLRPPLDRLAADDAVRVERLAAEPAAIEQVTCVILRTPPAATVRLARAGAAGGPFARAHTRALAHSLERAELLAAELAALGLRPRLLDGPGMSRLLLRRLRGLAPQGGTRRVEVVGALDARAEARRAIAAAERLLDLLRGFAVDRSDERRIGIGGQLEQVVAVAAPPEADARGWLAPLLDSSQSFALSVHVCAREDGMLDLGVYQSLREHGPAPDGVRLATAVDEIVRLAGTASGVRIDRGEFVQRTLWPATLPLGNDPGRASRRVDVALAANALPLFADRCGSPGGVPFARSAHGRVERLDPWDATHRHACVLIAGGSARERAQTAVPLVVRLAARGAAVTVLDAEGELAATCAGLGDAARVLDASDAEGIAELGAEAGTAPPVIAVDARGAKALLPLAGTAAALLSAVGDPGGERHDDEQAGRGALVVVGAERLLGEPGGARWLSRAATAARRDGCCVVLVGIEIEPFDAAGLLDVAPVRIVLSHPPTAAAALGQRFGLAPAEVRAIVADRAAATDDTPVALWLNGDRGRALVRMLDLPPMSSSAHEEAA